MWYEMRVDSIAVLVWSAFHGFVRIEVAGRVSFAIDTLVQLYRLDLNVSLAVQDKRSI